MRVLLVWLVLSGVTVGGCMEEEEPRSYATTSPAFVMSQCTVTTDRDRHGAGEPFTVTAQVTPLFRSRGRMLLRSVADVTADTTFVLRPVLDTLAGYDAADKRSEAGVAVEFLPGQPFAIDWNVRLHRSSGSAGAFTVRCIAVVDSIFVNDSNRYFSPSSAEVKAFVKRVNGVDSTAQSAELRLF